MFLGDRVRVVPALGLLLLGAGGCLQDAPLEPREHAAASLSLAAKVSGLPPGVDTRITVLVSYHRAGGSLVALGEPHFIALEAGGTSITDSVLVDLTACLGDPTRDGAGEQGCRLAVTVALLDTDDSELATQTQDLGSVSTGAHVTAPQAFVLAVPIGAPAKITVTLAGNTLEAGQTTGVTALVQDARDHVLSDVAVEWVSGNDAIASVTPTSEGALTATVTAIAVGATEIRAQIGSLASEPVTVTVTAAPPASVTVNLENSTLVLNTTTTTTATAVVRDAQQRELQGVPVTWTSSNPSVATVLPTAPGAATATVTAVAVGDAGVIATVGSGADALSSLPSPVSVVPEPLPKITVSIDLTTFAVNETVTATAVVLDPSGAPLPNEAVTWSSDAPGVASVSPTAAGAHSATVRGLGEGTAKITATLVSNSSVVSPPVPVLVTAPRPAIIVITLADSSLVVDQQVAATAVVMDRLGNVIEGQSVTWTSSLPAVATVTSTGPLTATVRGVDAGNTQIQAALGKLLSNPVAVAVNRVPSQLSFTQEPPPSVEKGQAFSVTVAVQDAQGRTVSTYAAPITVSLLGGTKGASLAGKLQLTPRNGVATFGGLSIDLVGTGYTLVANSGALRNATTKQLAVTELPPALMTKVKGDGEICAVNTFCPDMFEVRVTDRTGQPVSGAVVQWTAGEPSGDCTGKSLPVPTNSSGISAASNACKYPNPGTYHQTASLEVNGKVAQLTFTFTLGFPLTLVGAGDGSGGVRSDPVGIECSIIDGQTGAAGCDTTYPAGTRVVLVAEPSGNDIFEGWDGNIDCGNLLTCTVTMREGLQVTATFRRMFVLTVTGGGDGSGFVGSSDENFNCNIEGGQVVPGSDCSAKYFRGEDVKLFAGPSGFDNFEGWSGVECREGNTSTSCTLAMAADATAVANFTAISEGP